MLDMIQDSSSPSISCVIPSRQAAAQIILNDESGAVKLEHCLWIDDAGLQLSMTVHNNTHKQSFSGADIWQEDCFQIGIDKAVTRSTGIADDEILHIGLAGVNGNAHIHIWTGPDNLDGAEFPASFTDHGQSQDYSMTIPWTCLGDHRYENISAIGYSISYNNHRDDGNVDFYRWADGLINKFNPENFGLLIPEEKSSAINAAAKLLKFNDWITPEESIQCQVMLHAGDDAGKVNIKAEINGNSYSESALELNAGEHLITINIDPSDLAEGSNTVTIVGSENENSFLQQSFDILQMKACTAIAKDIAARVDWDRADLQNTDFAAAWQKGDAETAILGFIRHLRQRSTPELGYPADYIAELRSNATDEFKQEAAAAVDAVYHLDIHGGDHPDGRGTLLTLYPAYLHLAATAKDFDGYSEQLIADRDRWHRSAIHTSVHVCNYLQRVWALEECSDAALIPVFAFLLDTFEREWESTVNWGGQSHGTDGHNWWIHQHTGTWKIGLFFPEFKNLKRFQSFYPDYFEREASMLFHKDGFTKECSMGYHIGTAYLFLSLIRTAHDNGLRFSDKFYDITKKAADVEWQFMTPNGNAPWFGDCHFFSPYVENNLCEFAALYGSSEAKYLAETLIPNPPRQAGEMMIDRLHHQCTGENIQGKYDAVIAKEPSSLDFALQSSGYYCMRTDWTRSANFAAIEASARGKVVSSHGHSALFDLHLCSKGREILVGNGKGPDVGDMTNMDRMWRISTASHSTATVDGEEHVPIRKIYRFDRVETPTVDDWRSEPDFAYFSGSHEAYDRLASPVSESRRKLFYLRDQYWILIDRFYANSPSPHVYRQHFQVAVDVESCGGNRAVTKGDGGNLLFAPVPGADGDCDISPCPYPLEDYFNTRQLVFTREETGSFTFVTVLVPFLNDEMPDVQTELLPVEADQRILSAREATGLAITINGKRDIYVDQHMHWNLPWTCGGYSGDSRVFHSRCM
ncbi:MAG: heparinase II/III family protein [Lentisphaeria bacterium]|nr:heparinase II/III family protein [Lentisphaeria bacterium]NQZ66899.1 heparinase II/III family protein [Lentisphaeria bacterium]